MNKTEIADQVAGRTGLGKASATAAVDAVLAAVSEALANDEDVRIVGFGTFTVRNRGLRSGRNFHTGESLSIAASRMPSFKAGKTLKDAVNKGRQP